MVRDREAVLGREVELETLANLFAGGEQLVTLTGTAGIGKTRVARGFLSHWRAERNTGRSWFCDLSDATDAEGVAQAVSVAVGVSLASEGAIARALSAAGEALLVLDNCEHAVDAVAAALPGWMDAAPAAIFVVTSRERLHSSEEVVLEIPPLSAESARELFMARAQRMNPRFEADDEHVGALIERLDRLPLAIELAASRANLLSATQLLERLDDRFAVLETTNRDIPDRHATLRAAIAWSFDQLEPDAQRALAQASVFLGGFSFEAAAAVLDAGDDILQNLQQLRDKSLLLAEQEGGELRYRLFESIREHARDQLSPNDLSAALDRHATHFVGSARERLGVVNEIENVDDLRWLRIERENLLAAHRTAVARHPDLAVDAALVLHPLLLANATGAAHLEMLDATLVCIGDDPSLDRARLLWMRGRVAGWMENDQRAAEDATASLDVLDGLDDDDDDDDEADDDDDDDEADDEAATLRGHNLGMLALVAKRAGDTEEARARWGQALAIYRDRGLRWSEARTMVALGALEGDGGAELLDEALEIYRDIGAEHSSGIALFYRGDFEAARPILDRFDDDRYLRRLPAPEPPPRDSEADLEVGEQCLWFRIAGDEVVDLGGRPTLRQVLAALVAAHDSQRGEAVERDALIEAGWPGQNIRADSAQNRLRVAITRLRKLGLEDLLVTAGNGYALAADARIVTITAM